MVCRKKSSFEFQILSRLREVYGKLNHNDYFKYLRT